MHANVTRSRSIKSKIVLPSTARSTTCVPPTPVSADNWSAHLVHGLCSRHVRTVIRQGRVLVEDGQVLGVDAEAIRAHAREQAARLWERL